MSRPPAPERLSEDRFLRVTLAQFTASPGNVDDNVEQMMSLLAAGVADGAQLVCFPELCVPGYALEPSRYGNDMLGALRRADDVITAAARKHGVQVMYGSARQRAGQLFNVVVLVDCEAASTVYAKTHVPSAELSVFTAGEELVLTRDGDLALACCYDLAFPQLCAELAGAGARALFFPMAWEEQRAFVFEAIVAARAIENVAYVVCVNQSGSFAGTRFHGGSRIVDPVGETVVQMGNETGFATGNLDLAWVTSLRSSATTATYPLLADRRAGLPVRRGPANDREARVEAADGR
jgi:predicted amidohydrolase